MPEQPPRRTSKRSQRLLGDPLADLDQQIADATSSASGTAGGQAPAVPPVEEPLPAQVEVEEVEPAAVATVCPYLGTAEDPTEHILEPNPRHRCYGAQPPLEIFEAHQEIFCLTSEYPSCEMFLWVNAADAQTVSPAETKKKGLLRRK